MKKVLQIVATVGFSLIAVTSVASAQAQQYCEVKSTGPSSVNVCTNTETLTCTVTSNNTITVNGSNYQGAQSGTAVVANNTNAGSAGSGSANNSNSSTVNITVTNPNRTDPANNSCVVVTTTHTPITPAAQPVGGAGSAQKAPVKVAQLPKTSGNSPLAVAGIVAVASAVAAVLARSASFAYGRIKG